METLLPTPKELEIFPGETRVKAAIDTDYAPFRPHLEVLSAALEKLYGIPLRLEPGGIRVTHRPDLPDNAYALDSRQGILLSASGVQGLLYALATALHVIRPQGGELVCDRARILDWPEKDYRGLMVDLARCWHPPRQIFCYIDLCFALKLRYLHLHFMDDENYTLPSRVLPGLPGARHYSREDIGAFRAYAKARGVILIPEFEVPGHSRQLVSRYPEIFANQLPEEGPDSGETENGVAMDSGSLICPGKPEALETLSLLLEEVCDLFPDAPYIHIGGDEAGIPAWGRCPRCRSYMARQGLADPEELYSAFVGQMARKVLALGRTPIVWEGFPQKGTAHIPKQTIVIAWESHYHLAPQLLESGFRVINASWEPLYCVDSLTLHWGPKEILAWNVYRWQHWWPKSQAHLNPIQVAPTEQVLGAQLCAWECTYEREIGTVIHKAIALSERVWTVRRLLEEDAYHRRHKAMVRRLALLLAET